MANYNIPITDGSGSIGMKKGVYTVTVEATGYDATTLTPTSYTVTDSSTGENFTVEAAGTLTFNVNETGAAGGTPITAGSLIMTNATGDTDYGTAVAIGTDGNAVFEKVPYGTSEAPFALYFRQIESDDDHDIFEGVISVSMIGQTQTEYVQNNPIASQQFTLSDATYGMPVASATLTMTGA